MFAPAGGARYAASGSAETRVKVLLVAPVHSCRGVLCGFYGVVLSGRIMQRDILRHLPIVNAEKPLFGNEETLSWVWFRARSRCV